jgi:geranylgeranyl reductase
VREIDLVAGTALVGAARIGWRHLVGADGADSAVRRALGLPSPRTYFAAEYNLPGTRLEPLRVECDRRLGGGYFWVFPHAEYSSIGAVAPKRSVRPAALRRYLDARVDRLGLSGHGEPFEGATLEVEFRGLHFGEVHLAGDAAGVPSALTAEGIYSALVTGEEVARGILEPGYGSPRTVSWLRVKRRHDRFAAMLRYDGARAVLLPMLDLLAACRPARRPMADWFLAG